MLNYYRLTALCTSLLFCSLVAPAQLAGRYSVLITEIMADPSPAVLLPGNEWVELRNNGTVAFNLLGWRLGDASGLSGPLPAYLLKPDSFVVVCPSSALGAMQALGPAIAVTAFPSLDNGGDLVQLRSPQNRLIHAVGYTDAWYQNDLKKEGGWSLEMVDARNPCTGMGNWKASTHGRGGTPGQPNAVQAANADTGAPQLLRAFAADSLNIALQFSEPLDSLAAVALAAYQIGEGIGAPVAATCLPPLFNRVALRLGSPLLRNKIYAVTAGAGITDCVGNALGSGNTARVALAEPADGLDVVINEILFNPRPNGTDYVELYNRSNKTVDLRQLYIASRGATGAIGNIKQLSAEPWLLFPQGFVVATDDPARVKALYITQDPAAFATVAGMPSFANDKGQVVLLNGQGTVVDELAYDEKWHFQLIDNREGITLERVNVDAPTQQADNWHSAAASVGYGTPTYKNSQHRADAQLAGSVSVTPGICSPNNDGTDDFVTIDYRFDGPGNVANITVFDAAGRAVRYLQRNALCGTKGSFRWDGLGEKGQWLPAGLYIVYTAVFNVQGKTGQFKNVVVVGR
jgi:hypothetical protein